MGLCHAIHQWVCSAASPFITLCAHKVALPSAPAQPEECRQLALVSLRHCFHEATSTDALKSSFRTTVVMHFDLLWELRGRFKPNPGPTPTLPTAAKASSIPAVAAPVVHSDVLQTLNLQSHGKSVK